LDAIAKTPQNQRGNTAMLISIELVKNSFMLINSNHQGKIVLTKGGGFYQTGKLKISEMLANTIINFFQSNHKLGMMQFQYDTSNPSEVLICNPIYGTIDG